MQSQATEPVLIDEHIVLLWQACAYADDLIAAALAGPLVSDEYAAMLEFLHGRLLPYLDTEERSLASSRRGPESRPPLVAEHDGLRACADDLEASPTRRTLIAAARTLVDLLESHLRREDAWALAAAS
ncbi:MAG TPA: hemerythrin domain-containing protein [Mycobacteriales bacterium]